MRVKPVYVLRPIPDLHVPASNLVVVQFRRQYRRGGDGAGFLWPAILLVSMVVGAIAGVMR